MKSILGYKYEDIFQLLTKVGLNLLACIGIIVLGFYLANYAGKLIARVLRRSKTDEGLITFLTSFTVLATKVLVVLSAMSQLGIAMTSFVTILGAAGIAVGMAFSGTLSNFAGGIMILVIKPFKVKDTISALLVTGEVTAIQIFNTFIKTPDNKVVVLPNGPLANGTIINFTKSDKRRIDIIIPVIYGRNSEELIGKIEAIVAENTSVLKEPKPQLFFTDFEEKFGRLNLICWVKTAEYSKVNRELSGLIFQWVEAVE